MLWTSDQRIMGGMAKKITSHPTRDCISLSVEDSVFIHKEATVLIAIQAEPSFISDNSVT